MKKTISLLLSLLLTLSLVPTAFASNNASLTNFQQTATYTVGQFTDVKSGEWYEEGVKSAYELGLVKGSSDTTFSPAGSITIAETLALASRLHSIYNTGKAEFEQGTIWYEVYVTYAIANGIITEGQFSSYTAKATRAEFAQILTNAVDENALTAINTIDDIPDVTGDESYGNSVYLLYKAGVLTGSDKYGTFHADKNIQRSEVATIVSRMACSASRKTFVLEEKPIPVNIVSLNKTSYSCTVGSSFTLTATIEPQNATEQSLAWSSSDNSVANVNQYGTVTALKIGTANISVDAGNGKIATCVVTVREASITDVISAPTEEFAILRGKNSVGLVKLNWTATNNSGKTIKYYTVTGYYYNSVGDPAKNDITGKTSYTVKYVGPVEPGEMLLVSEMGYCSICRKVIIGEVKLEFTDGTSISGWYGYSFTL